MCLCLIKLPEHCIMQMQILPEPLSSSQLICCNAGTIIKFLINVKDVNI